MATSTFLCDEQISAEIIDGENIQCPRKTCSSRTLVLFGNSQVSRTETMEEGKVTESKIDQSSHAFEIEIIECLACQTRWHIQTREVAELERRCETLRQLLLKETGKDPYGMGKAN